jgi:acetoin utilization deacetylase AcuC-like enzyme
VAEFAPQPGRLALFLEGGYDLEAIRASVAASVAAAVGSDYRSEGSTSGGPGMGAVAEAARAQAEAA